MEISSTAHSRICAAQALRAAECLVFRFEFALARSMQHRCQPSGGMVSSANKVKRNGASDELGSH
jgi:hypothetical protein